MSDSQDHRKWKELHPDWQRMIVQDLVDQVDQGLDLQVKCLLLRNPFPELLDYDPRFPTFLEQAKRELGHLQTDPALSEPDSPWAKAMLEQRYRIWEWAIEILEQGNYQLLWQKTLVEHPELIHTDPRLKEVWELKPQGELPALTPWQQLRPSLQVDTVETAVAIIQRGGFDDLIRYLEKYPEIIPQDIRLQEASTFYQQNPPEPGQAPKPMRWKDFSAESQALIVERARKHQFTLKYFLKAYPEVKKLHPDLPQALKAAKEQEKQERWNSGDFTWRELQQMQSIVLETCLENLENGLLDSVEEDLEKWPQLAAKDPRLQEIKGAMPVRRRMSDDSRTWQDLTEPSRKFILEAALRKLESSPGAAKLLVDFYPELREKDPRLAAL